MSMNAYPQNQITLYISAAPELAHERDVLGRTVTSIPTSLGWQIVQTPHGDQTLNLDALAHSHVHLLVLSSDIKAPVGLEWQIARRAGRSPILFKRDTLHTPAADAFIRELAQSAPWRTYQATDDLRLQTALLLVDYILARANMFALNAAEIEQLSTWQKELAPSTAASQNKTRGDAGDSGVILPTERYVPSTGKLIE